MSFSTLSSTIRKSLYMGYALSIFLLLAAGSLSYYRLLRLLDNKAWVEHTYVVLAHLERVLSLMKDAETAQRGYLLTGDGNFLEPFRSTPSQIQRQQRILVQLTADNPAQQQRLDTLNRLIQARFTLLNIAIAKYQRGQGYEVSSLRTGRVTMDQLRALTSRLQRAERGLLAQRRRQAADSSRVMPTLIGGFTVWALLLAGLTSWRLQRSRNAEERARREIVEQQLTLQAFIDASPDGLALYEWQAGTATTPGDFRLRLLNPASYPIVHATAQDIGRWMSERFPDTVTSGRLARYEQVMRTGQPWETEFYSEFHQRWFRVAAARTRHLLLLTFNDITLRKQQEQAALDYEHRKYEAVFNQTYQVMCLLDLHGRFLDVNRTGIARGTSTPGPYVGRYWGDSPTWTLPGVAEQMQDALARAGRGEHVRYDAVLRRPDGRVGHMDVSLTPVQGQQGEILFLLAELHDITERVWAEQALKASHAELHELSQTLERRVQERTQLLEESRSRFAQLLEALPNMAWTSRPDGTLDYYNQQWADFTGHEVDELLQQGWQCYIHPEDLALTTAAWQHALRRQEPISNLHNRWKHGLTGEYRWHLVRAVPVRNASGAIVLWVGSNTDVHAQQLQQRELERVNQSLDTFIYTASHDLKTPINNIEALVTALREELMQIPCSRDLPQFLDLMQGDVNRFKRTIKQLTDVVQLEKIQEQPVTEVNLLALLEDVRADLRPLLAASGGQITVDIAACPTLTFAEKNLRSIVFNLLGNALKYQAPGRPPRVRVHCAPAGSYQVLSVHDNGLGLSPPQQARLFGLFRRLHDHVEGSGLGLYMVKKLIDQAGGRIEVESEPDVGTTFRVFFPILFQ